MSPRPGARRHSRTRLERWAAAAAWLALAGCARGPADAGSAAAQAAEMLRAGDPAAAEYLADAVNRWPDHAALRELQGDADLAAGRGDLALAAFERAQRLEPGNRNLAAKIGRALLQQGRPLEVLQRLQANDSDSPGQRLAIDVVRLEAAGSLSDFNFLEVRREAERLWRLAAAGPDEPLLAESKARLAELARSHEVVEAGRQHATCHATPESGRRQPDAAAASAADVIRVGPGRRLKRPSEAAAVAVDGSIVEIDAADYDADVAVWTQDRLTLRGVGGRPHLRARGRSAEDAGIWVLKGDGTTVENIEFSGARGRHGNGSGIRLYGSGLVVRDCAFHDNQNGILSSNETPDSAILVTGSEFSRNTSGGEPGMIHNIYIGRAASFTLEFSYVHDADFGHNVKSRARVNRIRYNRIADGERGRASYLIDFPEGGIAEVIGNELHKGPQAENRPIVAYGAEAATRRHAENAVTVAFNTLYSQSVDAVLLRLALDAPAVLVDNLLAGAPVISLEGKARADQNMILGGGGMRDPRNLDFRLTPDSRAIDAGVTATADGQSVALPEWEYLHPRSGKPRRPVWLPDMGAHEFCAQDGGS